MLAETFEQLYVLLRGKYYSRIAIEVSKGHLSVSECFSLEVVMLMRRPTIKAFATYLGISLSNANYRINSLVEKGYLTRMQSAQDKRETLLVLTDQYKSLFGPGNPDIMETIREVELTFSQEELAVFTKMLDRVTGILDTEKTMGDML